MPDTFLRVLTMLRAVPTAPRRVDTLTLQRTLAGHGFEVDLRTIQRDLARFSAVLGLTCDDRTRPYGWYYIAGAAELGVPGVDPARALVFDLAERHLAGLLPASVRDTLGADFRIARAALQAAPGAAPRWLDRVRVLPRGPRLEPPPLAAGVFEAVSEALFRDQQAEIHYQGRGARAASPRVVSPLGLVARGPTLYLVASFGDRREPRQFLLHRMTRARALPAAADAPAGFRLDDYIASGAFGFRLADAPIRLRLRVAAEAAPHVLETRLSEAQTVKRHADGDITVEADVHETMELHGWLLSLGDLVEVQAPAALRASVAAMLRRAAARYEAP